MIKITIEKTITEQYKETMEFVTKRTPTEHREKSKSSYDPVETVVFAEEREPREVLKQRTRTVNILEQAIERDEDFDLAAVIKAINKL
jgi:hypothetical protein